MKFLRRLLGIIVMLAGILGLVLSLAMLVGLWVVKPNVNAYAQSTIDALNSSVSTSQQVMKVTGQALGATVDSVDALADMLNTTAASVEDTQPVLDNVNTIMGEKVPTTLKLATDSLMTAQQAARVLEGAIKSLENFRTVLSAMPMMGALVELPEETYDPEVPLADSFGEIAVQLEDLPDSFLEMSSSMSKADDNLSSIQGNLNTMSESARLISKSLEEYQRMIGQSESSMDNLKAILTNVQSNLPTILNGVTIVMTLFLVWLLITQVVILTQGWELYQGTASRIESGSLKIQEEESEEEGKSS